MAAPLASYIRYPGDGNYTGKSVKLIERRVGADVTYTQVAAPISQQKIDGVYCFSSGVAQAVQATAHDGSTTGFFWLQNPVGSTKLLRLRQLSIKITNATAGAIAHATAPRVGIVKCTFTGTFAGATATTTKRKTSDSSNVGDVRTAVTGATVAVGDAAWAALIPGNDITTAEVLSIQVEERWSPEREDDFIILAAGECLACYQLDNGTASDQRMVNFSGIWDEVDNA